MTGLLLSAAAAQAGVSAACRVPEVYLSLPSDLARTEQRLGSSRAVTVLVIGPAIGTPTLSPKRRSRLEHELENRLPEVNFTIIDDGRASGLIAEDFERIRSAISSTSPDLVLWQLGTRDAVASTDPDEFGRVLEQAAAWMQRKNIDLVLLDPPFVPQVAHERIYLRMVDKIEEVSDRRDLNVLPRYAFTRFWNAERAKTGETALAVAQKRGPCMPELAAEAIARALER